MLFFCPATSMYAGNSCPSAVVTVPFSGLTPWQAKHSSLALGSVAAPPVPVGLVVASVAGGHGGAGQQAEREQRGAEERECVQGAADRHWVTSTPFCSWHSSHMLWGWHTRQALRPLAAMAPCVSSQVLGWLTWWHCAQ